MSGKNTPVVIESSYAVMKESLAPEIGSSSENTANKPTKNGTKSPLLKVQKLHALSISVEIDMPKGPLHRISPLTHTSSPLTRSKASQDSPTPADPEQPNIDEGSLRLIS